MIVTAAVAGRWVGKRERKVTVHQCLPLTISCALGRSCPSEPAQLVNEALMFGRIFSGIFAGEWFPGKSLGFCSALKIYPLGTTPAGLTSRPLADSRTLVRRSRTLSLTHALTLNRFWNNRQSDAFVWCSKRLKASHGCSGRTCSRARGATINEQLSVPYHTSSL